MARHARIKNLGGGTPWTDSSPFAMLLDACGQAKSQRETRRVHAQIIKSPFSSELFIHNRLVDVYGKCGCLSDARKVFDKMPHRNTFTWNAILSTLTKFGCLGEAEEIFRSMPDRDQCSWNSMLSGFTQHERKVGFAQKVFNEMSTRNLISWNSLITCYEQNGPPTQALEIFRTMMEYGFNPDEITLASVLSACATLCAIKEGSQIHTRVIKCDKFRNDIVTGNALVDMYSKCSRLYSARQVFDMMPLKNSVSETSMVSGYAKAGSLKAARVMFTEMIERDIVSWNALIAGCTQNNDNEEALNLFRLLKRESVGPTHYTFGNLLNACANLADLQLGQQSHAHVLKHGFRFQTGDESSIFVGNSLVDMYMKCGSVEDGSKVFRNMLDRDRVSWNALIVGFAQNGFAHDALAIFNSMLEHGENPDHVTMIGVLSACSHAGFIEQGWFHFESITEKFGLIPVKDHYTCMVDLLGRTGRLDEAKDLIENMPMESDAVIWGSLLAACKVHRNIVLGEYVANKLFELNPSDSGPYVLLSNMYAERGRWVDVVGVRKLMKQQGVVKQPGCSWIEIHGQVHVFIVKDKKHPMKMEIYAVLKDLVEQMKRIGYTPNLIDQEAFEEISDLEMEMVERWL